MDTMQQDLGVLGMGQQQQKMKLIDILGGDLDSQQYRDNQETYFGNDQLSISVGGQQAVQDSFATIILRPQVANSVLNLKTMMYCGRFTGAVAGGLRSQLPINALAMFRPISIKISNFNKSYAYGEMYCQQVLEGLNKSHIDPYKRGLLMGNIDKDGSLLIKAGVGVNVANSAILSTDAFNSVQTIGSGIGIYAQAYHSYMNDYMLTQGTSGDHNFAIPLWLLFYPMIQALDPLLFIKFAGQIEFQFQTVPSKECIVPILACADSAGNSSYTAVAIASGQYTIADSYFFYQYSRLANTPQILNSILATELEYRPEYPISYQVPFASTTTLIFSTAKGQRLQQLTWAVHQQASLRAATVINSSSILFNGLNVYSGECILFPAYKITQVVINASGRVITLNAQSLSALHLISQTQNCAINYPYLEGQNAGRWRDLRCVYNLDLTRFGFEDMIGSSNGQSENVTVTITWAITEDLSIYSQFTDYSGIVANGAFTMSNSMVYGFLIVSSKMLMKNGEYFESNQ